MGALEEEIDTVDIRGSLETVANLALLGIMCINLGEYRFIPTLLEDICEHSQRLTLEYAATKEKEDGTIRE